MKKKLLNEDGYVAPVCKVFSINLEGAIAKFSSGDEVDPSPEDDWGDL